MSSTTILVVDDEKNIRRTLQMVLEGEGHGVLTAASAEDGLSLLEREPIDLVIMDVKLPKQSGIEALESLSSVGDEGPPVPVIMISGHATVPEAVRATRLGAYDFFEKPIDRQRVLVSVRNALKEGRMRKEVEQLRAQVQERHQMVGTSEVMETLFRQIEKVAPTKAGVLITGESGTGKELIARAIHQGSLVRDGPFVKVNCAAIPPELIESELFGHEKGAFTGAVGRKRGLFEMASGGTIFLDEIGDMSLPAQAKVLRTLQSGEITRVGGERVFHVDVRVVAATNKNLTEMVESGGFREDLYFRLNVIPIESPPLRERRSDIPRLVEGFISHFCRVNGFRPKRIEPGAIELLERHSWPGNVRELKNLCERLVILSGEIIVPADVPPEVRRAKGPALSPAAFDHLTLREFREEMERTFIVRRLREFGWNISRTATALGIERTNLHKKIKAFKIQREDR